VLLDGCLYHSWLDWLADRLADSQASPDRSEITRN
jgi:hypothetical protein